MVKSHTMVARLTTMIFHGQINADGAAIRLYESGTEVTDEIYDSFRSAENQYQGAAKTQPFPMFKAIAYAYPTSETASKAGKPNGCYFIQLLTAEWALGREPWQFFDTKEQAIKCADRLKNEYHPAYSRLYDIADGHRERTYEEKALPANTADPAEYRVI